MITLLQFILLLCFVLILAVCILQGLITSRMRPVLFYYCFAFLSFIFSLLFFSKYYSFLSNTLFSLPDARITVLYIFILFLSSLSFYLLYYCSILEANMKIINRQLTLLSSEVFS